MDVFGPITPAQKGKAIAAALDEVVALLTVNNDAQDQREFIRNEVLAFVHDRWRETAEAFAMTIEEEHQKKNGHRRSSDHLILSDDADSER